MRFAPLVDLLASGCKQGRVLVWAPPALDKPVAFNELPRSIHHLAWGLRPSSSSLLLAACDAGGTLTTWPMGPTPR